jgi:hypothetical protein
MAGPGERGLGHAAPLAGAIQRAGEQPGGSPRRALTSAFPALREGRRPPIVPFASVAAETGIPGQAGLHRWRS